MYFCIYDESKLSQVGLSWSWADKAGIPFYLLPAHCSTTLPVEPASTLPTSINCQGFAEHTWKSPDYITYTITSSSLISMIL